jgi:hypothetical protein
MRLTKLIAPALAAAVVLTNNLPEISAQQQDQQGQQGQQEPRGRRGGGGPGGFGGGPGGFGGPGAFGGAMFGRGGVGGDVVLISLLRIEAVREELELDPDQLEGLRKLNERLRPTTRPDFDFRAATPEQRAAFTERMGKEAAERASEAKAHVEELLLPDQMDRLEQIAIQVQGTRALLNPEVAKELGLNPETTAKMSKEIEANAEQIREMAREAMQERNFDGIREKTDAMQKELDEKLLASLTTEQKAKFEEMKGDPFEMPQMVGFGRGGAGGFGGAGGPRAEGGPPRAEGGPPRAEGGRFGGRGGAEGREGFGRGGERGRDGERGQRPRGERPRVE